MPRSSEVSQMADPHLHAIRMVAQRIGMKDHQLGRNIETARRSLWQSLATEDYDQALDWINTLEVALACLESEEHPAFEPVKKALDQIKQIVEDETEVDPMPGPPAACKGDE